MRGRFEPGTMLSHYRILSRLGAGGMGEIYLAEDTRLGRRVALKLLPPQFTKDEERVRRFEQEARAASALNHPNILTIYEIGRADDLHFIATEYIEGETLRERLRRALPPLDEVIDIGVQIAQALQAAHAAGITHRDIKPDNVMLRPDGYVKVLDFGLAKLTETATPAIDAEAATILRAETNPGTVMGTVTHMSPEQARGLRVDARSDIFSLGVVLYELVSGVSPFAGPTASDVLAAILHIDPAPAVRAGESAPEELQRITAQALRKDCDERYQAIGDLISDLRALRRRLEFDRELAERSGPRPAPTEALDPFATSIGQMPATTARRTRVRKAIDSLAVLPLLNASTDPNIEYLADGITECIINSLSQLPRLRVAPRGTVFRYRGLEIDPQRAGRELGVRAVVTGRVMALGDALIVRTELIDVAQQSQVWGEQYRRRLTDIFTLQEEISQEISEKLRLKLTGEEKKRLVKRYTENNEAYHLYLKGRYYTGKRTGEWIRKGIEHFQQAIDLDPNYALAYAGLADAYAFLASSTGGWAPREAYPKAKAAAERALELDEALGEAHCSLGFFRLLYDWDFDGAENEFKRALELSPNYANAHDGYGFYLKATGRHEASLKACERAQRLDPLSLFATLSLGWAYYFARQHERAIEQGRKALELDPNFGFAHWHLGMNHLQLGRYEEAVVSHQRAVLLAGGGPTFIAHLGHAYARAGRADQARQVLEELKSLAEHRYVSSYFIAVIHLGLGEHDEAMEWLERAYEERSGSLPFIGVEPMLDPLRGDARFIDLASRIRQGGERGADREG
ncbi:MAG: protein kinase [Acidobacteria bacterium]|nr:protein kinase [Acidobacteriota bacterium]MCW5970650.1 protein kinase [Blastocatellales bacterium]